MEKKLYINQVFRGIAPSQYFGVEGSYNGSTAIDPDLPIISTDVRTSGFPVPVGSATFSGANITGAVIREITHPKDNLLWTVQTNGKVVFYKKDMTGETLLGTVTGSNAAWAEYYNNYIYIFGTGASFNDISRVGPLNTLPYDGQSGNFTVGLTITGGTSGATAIVTADVDAGATGTLTLSNINGHFTDNETITDTSTGSATVNRTDASLIANGVWTGATLGTQTALTNTKYPTFRSVDMPNHVGHSHSDGSLYFCDFKNGQGYIHRINTKTVTNEGDTNGTTVPSLYNALDLPFGFYPTDTVPYGTDIMIIGIYQTDTTTNQGRSAAVIWDPTNTSSFHTGPIPFSDPIASAAINSNGTVYIWTGNAQNGVRLSIYNGGVSVRELVYQEEGFPPFAGAVDTLGNRVVWGGNSTYPLTGSNVFAYGSKNASLPQGLHNVMKTLSSSIADSYSESNAGTTKDVSLTQLGNLVGQSFTGNGGSINTCKFYLNDGGGSPTGKISAKVYAHTGVFGTSSKATGTALATSNEIDVSSINGEIVTFTFNTPYTTVNATKYVIAVEVTTVGTGIFRVIYDNTTSSHAGNMSDFTNGGIVQNTYSALDVIFYVYTTGTNQGVTALRYVQQNSNITPKVVPAWRNDGATGIDQYSTTGTLESKIRWIFNIGTQFDVTRVSIPLAGAVASGTIISPTLYFDDLSTSIPLTTIDNTNYSAKRKVVYKGTELKNCIGRNNFILEISYTGTDPLPVALPIIITVDLKEDEN